MVSELNKKFLTGLGEVDNPVKIGSDVNPEEMDAVKLVFVGSSHATRLAAAAEKLSIASSVVKLCGGRITAAAVEDAAKKLQEELASSVGTVVVVFTIYDNNAFFGVGDDGSKSLPVKGDSGECRYHVPGKLEVADHSVVKSLVNLSIPLLRAAGEKEKIILSPLPRYMLPCCQSEEHITNRKSTDFKESIVDSLREFRQSLKDLVFGKKLRSFKILDPIQLMYGDEGDAQRRGFWKSDPIHPTSEGYEQILQGAMASHAEARYNRHYTAGTAGKRAAGGQQRQRRQSWVNEDDTTAHRVYLEEGRFRGRGRGSRARGYGGNRGGGGGAPRGSRGGGPTWRGRGNNGGSWGYKKNRNQPY
jgi:hypothetical protein